MYLYEPTYLQLRLSGVWRSLGLYFVLTHVVLTLWRFGLSQLALLSLK